MRYVAFALSIVAALVASRANSQTFTTLIQFTGTSGTATGNNPQGSLTLSGTKLYGTTYSGGSNALGNLFSVGVNGSGFQNLVSFSGNDGATPGTHPYFGAPALSGTTLYGMTEHGNIYAVGNVFSVGTDGSGFQNLLTFSGTNGNNPLGALTLSGTKLYGMTQVGGSNGDGNVFGVGIDGSGYQNLLSFSGSVGAAPGAVPNGSLTLSGTTLYGMTSIGGSASLGNVFSVAADGSGYRNLLSFSGTNGTYPDGSLTLSGTTLYGMTSSGGSAGVGNVFRVGVDGSGYQNLLSFSGWNGKFPTGSLILSGTTLYGMSYGGGIGEGNVFSVGVNGSGFQNLYSFTDGSDGAYPQGDLTLSGGTLFGMTSAGGADGYGTVFALVLQTNTWAPFGSGSWNSAGNWASGAVPDGPGVPAILGRSLTASSTVTLDGNQMVGSLTFNNGTASYTLSAGSGGSLTFDNTGGTGSQILLLAGTHSITAPVKITDGNLTVAQSSHSRLAISGNISDDNGRESLTVNGDGTGVLVLSGTNTYGGGTIVQAGTLVVTNRSALLTGGSLSVGNNVGVFSAPVIPAAVPEPSTLGLLALATISFFIFLSPIFLSKKEPRPRPDER